MRFAPKSADEIAQDGLLKPGVYDFEIAGAEDAISKSSGAEMIKLRVKVFDLDGGSTIIFDYLMESVAYKLRHAAEVCGLERAYERGELNAFDFEGKVGRVKVAIQKDKTGQYPDKNSIADYLPAEAGPAPTRAPARTAAPAMAGGIDDDIPF